MDLSISLQQAGACAICECKGEFSVSDSLIAISELWNTAEWTGEYAIWDFKNAKLDLSPAEVKKWLSIFSAISVHHRPKRLAL